MTMERIDEMAIFPITVVNCIETDNTYDCDAVK